MSERERPSIRVWVLGPFQVERRQGGATWEAVEKSAWEGSYARLLFKRLLCASGRRSTRSELIDDLWPERSLALAEKYLNNASSKLHQLLQGDDLLTTFGPHGSAGYEVAGQQEVWSDIDACEMLLTEAERLGRTSSQALTLLEEASTYLERGRMLEGESAQWALTIQAEKEMVLRYCLLWQAEAYGAQGMLWHARRQYRRLLARNPLEEDGLCRLLAMLHRQGMIHDARVLYEEAQRRFEEYGVPLSQTTRKLAEQLRNKPLPPDVYLTPQPILESSARDSQRYVESSAGMEISISSITPRPARLSQTNMTDISKYRRSVRLALHLHRTSTAQGLLEDVHNDIQDLEHLECQTRGHDLYSVKELLIANHLLATKIVKDQRQYAHAYRSANNAVVVAKSLEDGDLIATTKYVRGCVTFEWAQFGTVKQGILQLNKEQVQDAIRDFQDVLRLARIQRFPLHPQLQGFTYLQVGRAYSLLYDTPNGSTETHPLALVDQAERMVDGDDLEDAYTRLIMTGTISGLHWGAYHLNKAEILTAMGMQKQALPELQRLRQLTERTYAQDETRNQTWSNMVMAEVLMGLEAYPEVTDILGNALLACRSINSAQITATILDLHRRLAKSSYGTSADVQEIGGMLHDWYGVA